MEVTMATFIHIVNIRFIESGEIFNFTALSKARAIEVALGYLRSVLKVYPDAPSHNFEDIQKYCFHNGVCDIFVDVSLLHEEPAEVA